MHSQERSGGKLIEEVRTHPEDAEPVGEEDYNCMQLNLLLAFEMKN